MTARCALCLAFLEGKIINVKNCFETIGLTNAAREVSRMVEIPFGITISRQHMTGKSRYRQPISWTNYRLNRDAEYNKVGIQKMREYCLKEMQSQPPPKTDKAAREFKQVQMLFDAI